MSLAAPPGYQFDLACSLPPVELLLKDKEVGGNVDLNYIAIDCASAYVKCSRRRGISVVSSIRTRSPSFISFSKLLPTSRLHSTGTIRYFHPWWLHLHERYPFTVINQVTFRIESEAKRIVRTALALSPPPLPDKPHRLLFGLFAEIESPRTGR